MEVAHQALVRCGFEGERFESKPGTASWQPFPLGMEPDAWIWAPKSSPGFRLIVDTVGPVKRVSLDQGTFWPPTRREQYRCLGMAARQGLQARFGERAFRDEASTYPLLTFQTGMVGVMLVSAIFAVLWSRAPLPLIRWAFALMVPFVLASLLYWSPGWMSGEQASAESIGWAPFFLFGWGIPGAMASVATLVILRTRRKKRRSDRG